MTQNDFQYADERFADLQMLRYRLNGFEKLSLRQKKLIYHLSEATLLGRDITFDQFGRYNLRIRKMLEAVYTDATIDHETAEFKHLADYLKRVWFSNGIYYVDKSHRVNTKREALEVGRTHNQISVLKWADMSLVYC